MEIKRNVMNKRAVVLLLCVLMIFVVLVGRFIFIQTSKEVNGTDLEALGKDRWTRSQVLKGVRGTIYDRSGGVLATELNSYTAYAILDEGQRSYVKDPQATAEKLSPYVNMPVDELTSLLSSDRFQVELGSGAKNMTHERMEEISALQLEGIFFREEPRRYYPKQTYASHVIGYTERDMATARMGLERSLDEQLRPTDGLIQYQSDRKGIPLPDPKQNITPAKNGHDVYLTLDSNIQTALDQVMTKVEEEYEPEKMIAIVADPKTGEILAMSNRPSFNPNHYEDITNYTNYAVSDRFEPGSTVKMFTLAAAIEEGVYNGEDTYQSGRYQIGPDSIPDHNGGRGWGVITYNEGLLRSSNVAFSKIALEVLGREKLYEYWQRFGFYEPTGIDLPNEADSLIADQYRIDAATTALGQGTALTPIQQVQAATAIANGGKMMKPYIIDHIVDPNTNTVVKKNEPEVVGEPISAETAAEVIDLLEQVVTSPAGTGRPYYLEGFNVVGKTGTAQIRNDDGSIIRGHGENIFSFLGMAPKEDPRVIVYVAVKRPHIENYEVGSEPTAMIFNTIMKHSLQYLNITPTMEEIEEEIATSYVTKQYVGQSLAAVQQEITAEGLEPIILGDGGTIAAQQPAAGKGILPGEKVMLRTNSEQAVMPDMTGWSNRDVRKFAEVMGMRPTIFGHGYVTTQNIEPGRAIKEGDFFVIELATPSREGEAQESEELDEAGEAEQEEQENQAE
ncbi:penicillin-binding protein [Alkalihalobacillus oceani]|uniref:serine-type D-Ala-D-Ala carboxypeptidase n=1 Tax=Halalkalibacter oceani TaxID=1653776 RepID=A0A9X2DPM9_9BACI|nr:penicillin-binding protein [Halalkalibacter oceani]MCM3713097.1 penicillin-binding protein [Halalkalibacter oceani]